MQLMVYGASAGTAQYLKRKQALTDFLAMGPGRSIEALARRYREQRRHKLNPPAASLNTLLRWAKEDRWWEQAAAYDEEVSRQQLKDLAALRERVLEQLAELEPDVIATFKELLQSRRDDVRLRAVEAWFDRVGVTRLSVTQVTQLAIKQGEPRSEVAQAHALPSDDAPEEEWERWLLSLASRG